MIADLLKNHEIIKSNKFFIVIKINIKTHYIYCFLFL